MRQSIVLSDFKLGFPDLSFSQKDINENFIKYMSSAHCVAENVQDQNRANNILLDVKRLIEKYAVKENYVLSRTVCSLENASFFQNNAKNIAENLPPVYENLFSSAKGSDISLRMKLFQKYALEFLNDIYTKDKSPDEIIYITSTGYHSPTPIQVMLNQKEWYDVEIKNCFNLDCYAAVPAVKLAMASLAENAEKKVDLIHTEIQSLHMDLLDDSPSNILVNSLFGDGAVKYKASMTATDGLKVLAAHETLIPNSLDQMGWNMGMHHFEMTLSPLVPYSIEENIEAFLEKFAASCESSLDEWKEKAIWAIHPGGPKIVDLVSKKLDLNKGQVRFSWEILKDHGNMSSSTLPYIWKKIVEDETVSSGENIISLAFGPGLTACVLWMQKL